jgi:hypothetical protein
MSHSISTLHRRVITLCLAFIFALCLIALPSPYHLAKAATSCSGFTPNLDGALSSDNVYRLYSKMNIT